MSQQDPITHTKRRNTVTLLFCALVFGAMLSGCQATPSGELLNRHAFRCLAVGESYRTVGVERTERRLEQTKRIERLLEVEALDELDVAKLKAEHAVVWYDVEEARFLKGCADTYYEPSRTTVRKTFEGAPKSFDPLFSTPAFESAMEDVEHRFLPRGFKEIATMRLADAYLHRGEYDKALEYGQRGLDEFPEGIQSDTFHMLVGDAYYAKGDTAKAVEHYNEVVKMRLGFEAQYARYRLAMIASASGDSGRADEYLGDLGKWASRSGRGALESWLKNPDNRPPTMKPLPIQ